MSKNLSGRSEDASSGNTGTVLSIGVPFGLRPASAELPLGWTADPSRFVGRRFGRPTNFGAFAGVSRRRLFEEDGSHGHTSRAFAASSVTAGDATAAANARRADRLGFKEPREAACTAAAMRAERMSTARHFWNTASWNNRTQALSVLCSVLHLMIGTYPTVSHCILPGIMFGNHADGLRVVGCIHNQNGREQCKAQE